MYRLRCITRRTYIKRSIYVSLHTYLPLSLRPISPSLSALSPHLPLLPSCWRSTRTARPGFGLSRMYNVHITRDRNDSTTPLISPSLHLPLTLYLPLSLSACIRHIISISLLWVWWRGHIHPAWPQQTNISSYLPLSPTSPRLPMYTH